MAFWNRVFGDYGEGYAVTYLKKNGFKILDRNFRTSHGEIDILAQKNNCLHAIEVKTRRDTRFVPVTSAFTKKKYQTIQVVLHEYKMFKNVTIEDVSIDLICLVKNQQSYDFELYENIVMENNPLIDF